MASYRVGAVSQAGLVIKDPGDAGVISVNVTEAVCNLTSAAAETRILAFPINQGDVIALHHYQNGGDITLTVAGGYDQLGTDQWTFADVGQFVVFKSFFDGTVFYWRKISDWAVGLLTPADQGNLESLRNLTVSSSEINNATMAQGSVATLTEASTLNETSDRKTFILSSATEFDTILPAPAAGLRVRFVVGAAPSGASYTVTTNGTLQNIIHGVVAAAEDAGGASAHTNGTAVDVVTFVDGKAKIGDWVELICDGTYWYLQGACRVHDGITLA